MAREENVDSRIGCGRHRLLRHAVECSQGVGVRQVRKGFQNPNPHPDPLPLNGERGTASSISCEGVEGAPTERRGYNSKPWTDLGRSPEARGELASAIKELIDSRYMVMYNRAIWLFFEI